MSDSSVGHSDPILLADGWEDCIIGLGYQFNKPLIVYSKNKVLAKLANQFAAEAKDNLEFDANDSYRGDRDFFLEAEEYFDFNIQGAWLGEGTPVFVDEDMSTPESINEALADYLPPTE
jgi:hypothetical protein